LYAQNLLKLKTSCKIFVSLQVLTYREPEPVLNGRHWWGDNAQHDDVFTVYFWD